MLCDAAPKVRTLNEERQMILESDLSSDVKLELMSVAMAIAGPRFSAKIMRRVFGGKEWEKMTQTGIIGELVEEGKAEGIAEGLRLALINALKVRFGQIPASIADRVATADADWCIAYLPRVLTASRIEELAY